MPTEELFTLDDYLEVFAPRLAPCTECEARPGDPGRYGRCLSCDYDVPPPVPCSTCGWCFWVMEEGWYCSRCWPQGPWVPGFGPDDERRPEPRMALQVKAVAARALGIPADDVGLEGEAAT